MSRVHWARFFFVTGKTHSATARTFVGWGGCRRRAHEGVSKSEDFAIFLENKEKNRTPHSERGQILNLEF